MKKNIFQIFILILFSIKLNATIIPVVESDYKKIYYQAEEYFVNENYTAALPLYIRLDSMEKGNANINFKIGLCYLNGATYKTKSISYFEEAIKNITKKYAEGELREKEAPISTYSYLAKAYQLHYDFDKAITMFEKYKECLGTDKNVETEIADVNHDIETCNNAKVLIAKPKKVTITNLGDSINSKFPDYASVVSLDEQTLIFTSRRSGGISESKDNDGSYFEDIYISHLVDEKWQTAKPISNNINTFGNEASVNLSTDGEKLFIYKDEGGNGNLYLSELKGEEWGVPQYLGADINTPAWETHACFSADNRILYFVTDGLLGFGGRDIYKCLKLPNGEWSIPQNLGPVINTKYDEDGVFIHPDGKEIFFSSKGHKSMGGFDIFSSIINDENGFWSEPVNVGYPINTPDNDIFFVTTADGKRAFFSSDKEGGYGEKDIYMITYEEYELRDVTILVGRLINNSSEDIPDNKITIINQNTGEIFQELYANSSTGKFGTNLPVGTSYKTIYTVKDKEIYSEILEVPAGLRYQIIKRNIPLPNSAIDNKTLGTISISGKILDKQNKPIPEGQILVKDNLTGKLINTYHASADSGAYYFVLDRGKNYNISYEAEGYLFQSENVAVPKKPEYSSLIKNIILEKVVVGSKIVLNNIFFDSNKATIRKESNLEIEKLLKLMTKYPEITVEVDGHTDSQGDDAKNLKLSHLRAQAVVNALIKKGISAKRLVAKGFGETVPVAKNTLPNGKPDLKGMQLNRRVELKIISAQ